MEISQLATIMNMQMFINMYRPISKNKLRISANPATISESFLMWLYWLFQWWPSKFTGVVWSKVWGSWLLIKNWSTVLRVWVLRYLSVLSMSDERVWQGMDECVRDFFCRKENVAQVNRLNKMRWVEGWITGFTSPLTFRP